MGVKRTDLVSVLQDLGRRRPIFHSEADFQHELAFDLRGRFPDCQVRMEVPFVAEARGATDIVLSSNGHRIGIELKYMTKALSSRVADEDFKLSGQGAYPIKRYSILKDVERLETFNMSNPGPSFMVALTNDPAYWKPRLGRETSDSDFAVHQDALVTGELRWGSTTGKGTMEKREDPLRLTGSYHMNWTEFSRIEEPPTLFQFLLIEVGGAI